VVRPTPPLLVVLGAAACPAVTALVDTGFCGALTTYSTFGWEPVPLREQGSTLPAALNAIGSVLAGLGAAGPGLAAGSVVGS
jgi:fluoride exporter